MRTPISDLSMRPLLPLPSGWGSIPFSPRTDGTSPLSLYKIQVPDRRDPETVCGRQYRICRCVPCCRCRAVGDQYHFHHGQTALLPYHCIRYRSRIVEILKQYADANIGFVDASLVAVAERLGINTIFTTDRRHFSPITV